MLNKSLIKNRTIFCHDNLDILRGINSACVDLIYLDPPFNKKKTFTAPIGSSAEGASFSDIFRKEDVKDEWLQDIKEDYYAVHDLLSAIKSIEGGSSYNFCYLAYMAIRLMECHRVLKSTGAIYLHCDQTMSHSLKLLMDCIFGETNFRNEILWCYHGPGSPKMRQFNRKSDSIFWYSKGKVWTFNGDDVRMPFKKSKQGLVKAMGDFSKEDVEEYQKKGKIPENWWEMRIAARSKTEYTGYPTQKPLMLLERIITASSNKGDVVLDPFCGCATTCVAAEKLDRNWIGVDVSIKAFELIKKRMKKEVEWEGSLFKEDLVNFKTSPPTRNDVKGDTRPQKYVYIISNTQYKGEWKVGIASNTVARLNSYQTSDPNRGYKLEYRFLTPHFREIEKFIHDKYDNRHEWVSGDLGAIKKDIDSWKS